MDNTQDSRKILSEKTVNYMNYCLYNAANNGTGGAAIFGGQTIAGKTGTTSSNRDRWFCGYTSHYTAAVWVGYDQPEQINIGTNPAAVLWRKVMQPIHTGLSKEALYNGNAFQTVAICLDSGKLATEACRCDARGIDRVAYVNVYPEDVPEETCDKHVMVDFCDIGGGVATEYCSAYLGTHVYKASLLKLNDAEIQEIRDAAGVGLNDIYLDSGGIYYDGDGIWTGFYNNYDNPSGKPYLECQLHQSAPVEETIGSDITPDWEFEEPDYGFDFGDG